MTREGIGEIHLVFNRKTFESLRDKKKKYKISWEKFIILAVENLK